MLFLGSHNRPAPADVHIFDGSKSLESASALATARGMPLVPLAFIQGGISATMSAPLPACAPTSYIAMLVLRRAPGYNGENLDVGTINVFGKPAGAGMTPQAPIGSAQPLRGDYNLPSAGTPTRVAGVPSDAMQAALSTLWGDNLAIPAESNAPKALKVPVDVSDVTGIEHASEGGGAAAGS